MENQFLRGVAAAFVAAGDLDCEFVLPNRRSLKFFQKHLGQEYGKKEGKPLLSPAITTINTFFSRLGGLAVADWVDQMYVLYIEYIKLKYPQMSLEQGCAKEPFDEFVYWGDTILKDFNDIDKYMVNARQLFTNVKDLKEIESDFSFLSPKQLEAVKCFWTNYLKGGEFSAKKEFFSSVWQLMYPLYCNFNAALQEKGVGYEGQIYRKVAENVPAYDFSKKVVFIGFNAPNMCEKRVMQYLRDCGLGDFYWDFYGPMLTDERNGAHEIISECAAAFPSAYTIADSALPAEQQYKVYACSSGVGQALVLPQILEELFPGGEVDEMEALSTAIVLPDEKLLLPVLNSIPQKFSSVNVTMGYPITSTSFISFMDMVMQLQLSVKEKKGEMCFYHKNLLALLSHDYIRRFSSDRSKAIKEGIIKANMIYVSPASHLLGSGDDILTQIFKVPASTVEFASYIKDILRTLDGMLDKWDREFLYQYYLRICNLSRMDIPMEVKTWIRLADRMCRSIMVPFKGEPLAGLQVMGTLETRALDFDNVIILSANEGKFPSSNVAPSVVPYNLRLGFGLPTYELQDGIAAYHFYRSISRARNIYMVYDTRSEGITTGEASRYIKQLKYHFGVDVKESAVAASPVMGNNEVTCVVKSEEIMEQLLRDFTGDGKRALSASSLNTYISCPLRFYLETVQGLREEDEVEESVESNVFGSIFHHVMEKLYEPFEGRMVGAHDVERISEDTALVERLVLEGFKEYMNVEKLEGQHKIVDALIKRYVQLALDEDRKECPFQYVAGEGKFYYKLNVDAIGADVNFKAYIDRIDKVVHGSITRIADYKTGSAKATSAKFELDSLFDKSKDRVYKHVLQLYLYALIYFGNKMEDMEEFQDVRLTIYPLKTIAKDGLFDILLEKEKMQEFIALLKECVAEIFDSNIPFYANPQKDSCKYCPHGAMCNDKCN